LDLGLLLGLVVAVVSIIGADVMDGGSLAALLNPSAAVLVIGGTIGATAVSHALGDVLSIPALLARALRDRRSHPEAVIQRLVDFAVKARREGLLSLETELAGLDEPFLKRGLQMVVDGADPDMVRGVLETEIASVERRNRAGAHIFETAGGYAPTMGIIGTVMGLIHVLSNLNDASKLGPAIATAFLATFYGIATANVFWLPIGAKLKSKGGAELADRELMLEGILSIQRGDNPSIVRDKLSVYLAKAPAEPGERPADGAATQPGGEVA
jgi:chemotaxis protein MotA